MATGEMISDMGPFMSLVMVAMMTAMALGALWMVVGKIRAYRHRRRSAVESGQAVRHTSPQAERRRVLVLENEPSAGIGNFGRWLTDAGLAVDICRPYAGDPVPEKMTGHGLIVLGGPMGAEDDHKASWLPATRALLQHTVATETPHWASAWAHNCSPWHAAARSSPEQPGPK